MIDGLNARRTDGLTDEWWLTRIFSRLVNDSSNFIAITCQRLIKFVDASTLLCLCGLRNSSAILATLKRFRLTLIDIEVIVCNFLFRWLGPYFFGLLLNSQWIIVAAGMRSADIETLRASERLSSRHCWKWSSSAGDWWLPRDVRVRRGAEPYAVRQRGPVAVVDGQGAGRPAGVGDGVAAEREQLLRRGLVGERQLARRCRRHDDRMSGQLAQQLGRRRRRPSATNQLQLARTS